MSQVLDTLIRTSELARPRIVITNATVVTMDPAAGLLAGADVVIEDGKIVALGKGAANDVPEASAVVVDGTDDIICPGFVDTHRHCWQTQLRQIIPADSVSYSTYSNTIHQGFAVHYRPQDMYVGNLLAALTAIDSGVTTLVDWCHNSRTPEHSDAAVEALMTAGIRAVHVSGAPRFEAPAHEHPADIRRLRDEYFSSDDQLVTLAFGTFRRASTNEISKRPQGRAEPRPDLGAHLRLARELGLRTSVEGCSSPPSSADLIALGRNGELGPDTTYVHCLDLTDDAWRAIADSGGSVSVNASGAVEIMALGDVWPATQNALDHGIRPSLSLDTELLSTSDFVSELRSVIKLQRAQAHIARNEGHPHPPELLGPADALDFATLQGACANGMEHKTGSLRVGNEADLIVFSCREINTLPGNDPIGTIVQSAGVGNIRAVFVAGRPVKWDGELVGVNIDQVRDLARDSRDHLVEQVQKASAPGGA